MIVAIVAIVGATGTGKSGLSLDLAGRLAARGTPAEVINADAMQLYRGMDIGTAKLSVAERRGIPHHLLDVLEISDEASVAAYQVDARAAVDDVLARGAVPILVGGSGLYVSSVLWNFTFPGTDAGIRAALEAELETSGPGILYQRLTELDPEAAKAIGPHNGRRLVRALEVIQLTGEPFGAGLPDGSEPWRPVTILGLQSPRETLVPRLNARVERMWADGLLDEVRGLDRNRIGVTAARAIGYAQALAQLDGRLPETEAIEQAASLTRRYARRQVGWFRRYPKATWFDADDAELVDHALGTIDA
ncbi:MAG: tRNA dimethylallyltransferase [Actinomycetota bacterium]|nr:tRNA dimethylallyltransferase [Actinomycetota bacterium]